MDIIFTSAFDKGIGSRKGESRTGEYPLIGIFMGKGTTTWVNPAGTHIRKSPMSDYNSGKVPHNRCSLGVQCVTRQAFSQCFKGRPSAYHMVIKFSTENGVGVVRGDQRIAKECYSA